MGLCEEQVVSLQEDKDALLDVLRFIIQYPLFAVVEAEKAVELYGETEES